MEQLNLRLELLSVELQENIMQSTRFNLAPKDKVQLCLEIQERIEESKESL
jgi:hypothetical protein